MFLQPTAQRVFEYSKKYNTLLSIPRVISKTVVLTIIIYRIAMMIIKAVAMVKVSKGYLVPSETCPSP